MSEKPFNTEVVQHWASAVLEIGGRLRAPGAAGMGFDIDDGTRGQD